MKALLFVARELAEQHRQAGQLIVQLEQFDLPAQLIDKSSSKLDDLLLIAKYGVVEPVVFLVVDRSGVRVRLTELPSLAALRRIAHLLTPPS